jgi:predicted nuclease of predicted toxin-antitoxin system
MIIWIDAHLSPAIATWITMTFGITAIALRDRDFHNLMIPRY